MRVSGDGIVEHAAVRLVLDPLGGFREALIPCKLCSLQLAHPLKGQLAIVIRKLCKLVIPGGGIVAGGRSAVSAV